MAPSGSLAAVLFDLDNDGDLDLVTSDFNSAPRILVSNLAQVRAIHWLQVQLIGSTLNRDGLGALVKSSHRAHIPNKTTARADTLSQSSLPLYFGLGDDAVVSRVEVLWPSGRNQAIKEGIK